MTEILRFLKPLFWLTAIVVYALAVEPNGSPTISSWDKANHMIAFFTIAVLVRPAYRTKPAWLLMLLLTAFGALIELTQAIPALHRDASWLDLFADMVASVVGLGVGQLVVIASDRWTARG